jgi:hypothetical protein
LKSRLSVVSERVGGRVREFVVCELFFDIWSTVLALTVVAECTVNLNELGEHVVLENPTTFL